MRPRISALAELTPNRIHTVGSRSVGPVNNAQVGDAKGIRQKITEMKMRLIKDALRATGAGTGSVEAAAAIKTLIKAPRPPAPSTLYGWVVRGPGGPELVITAMYAGLGFDFRMKKTFTGVKCE